MLQHIQGQSCQNLCNLCWTGTQEIGHLAIRQRGCNKCASFLGARLLDAIVSIYCHSSCQHRPKPTELYFHTPGATLGNARSPYMLTGIPSALYQRTEPNPQVISYYHGHWPAKIRIKEFLIKDTIVYNIFISGSSNILGEQRTDKNLSNTMPRLLAHILLSCGCYYYYFWDQTGPELDEAVLIICILYFAQFIPLHMYIITLL